MRAAVIESERVHAELVSALFTATIPLVIMTSAFLFVGWYIYVQTGTALVLAALIVGMLFAIGKIFLHLWFRRSAGGNRLSAEMARAWDRRFAIGNLGFAAAIGSLLSTTFTLSHTGAQLLATGVLFGFCSGQVARVAVRPRLTMISIFTAATPCAFSAALHHGTPFQFLAGMFAVFAIGSVESVLFAHRQATDRITLNHELESIASIDPLTALLNRFGLRRAVAELWNDLGHDGPVAIHCFDLDGFKALNDRLGHAAGDALLVELARRVVDCLKPGDVAARLGGDEFVVIQAMLSHPDEAEMFARRICRAVTAPYHETGNASVGVSVGTCVGKAGRDRFEDMLEIADRRMYAIKQSGGGVHTLVAAPAVRV